MKKKDINTIPEEILGLAALFNPFASHISSSRIGMMAHSLSQFQLPKSGEFPNIFTGYEFILNEYEYIIRIIGQHSQIIRDCLMKK